MKTYTKLVLFGVVSGATSSAFAVYDAASDFAITSNPNGAWSYGWSTGLTSSMTPYTASSTIGSLNFWQANIAGDGNPTVSKNTSSSTVQISSVTWDPGQMVMHPGPNGEYSIVRFTAPTSQNYALSANFIGRDVITTTDVNVLVNGASVFSDSIFLFGDSSSFSNNYFLNSGDTVDLRVGFGSNSYLNDSTGANLTMTPVPEPASMCGIALGGLALLKRRRTAKQA
jgi:archaellum component FlaG (FlaF/FlaG flagellin family)